MDHAYFRDRVSAYHDRELPLQELTIVEEHIRGCAECQKLLAEIEKLEAAVNARKDLADSEYWEELALKTEERLGFIEKTEVTPIKRWDRGLTWKITAVAASLAILTFIGLNKDQIIGERDVLPLPSPEEKVQPQKIDTEAAPESLPIQDEVSTTIEQAEPRKKAAPSIEGETRRHLAPETVQLKIDRAARETDVADDAAVDRAATPPSNIATTPPATSLQEESARVGTESQRDERVQPLPVEPRITKDRLQPPETEPETAPGESTEPRRIAKSKETREASSLNKSITVPEEQKPYAAAAVAEPDSAAQQAELVRWRAERDSLTRVLKDRKLSQIERRGISSFRSSDSGARRIPSAAGAEQQQAAIERAYLEASYHVALLTSDNREYRDARASLEEAGARGSSANARLARQYLKQLDRNRADRSRK